MRQNNQEQCLNFQQYQQETALTWFNKKQHVLCQSSPTFPTNKVLDNNC